MMMLDGISPGDQAPPGRVTVCHWKSSGGWNQIEVSVSALEGHSQHDLDIWTAVPGLTPGMNWPVGEGVYDNGCQIITDPSPTPTATPTATPSVSVTPSPSVTPEPSLTSSVTPTVSVTPPGETDTPTQTDTPTVSVTPSPTSAPTPVPTVTITETPVPLPCPPITTAGVSSLLMLAVFAACLLWIVGRRR
jgi:hypothetical protein